MTKEDILRLRDTAEQTRVQFFDKRSGNAERKERVTRDNKYDVSCEIVTEKTEIKETEKTEITHCLRNI